MKFIEQTLPSPARLALDSDRHITLSGPYRYFNAASLSEYTPLRQFLKCPDLGMTIAHKEIHAIDAWLACNGDRVVLKDLGKYVKLTFTLPVDCTEASEEEWAELARECEEKRDYQGARSAWHAYLEIKLRSLDAAAYEAYLKLRTDFATACAAEDECAKYLSKFRRKHAEVKAHFPFKGMTYKAAEGEKLKLTDRREAAGDVLFGAEYELLPPDAYYSP